MTRTKKSGVWNSTALVTVHTTSEFTPTGCGESGYLLPDAKIGRFHNTDPAACRIKCSEIPDVLLKHLQFENELCDRFIESEPPFFRFECSNMDIAVNETVLNSQPYADISFVGSIFHEWNYAWSGSERNDPEDQNAYESIMCDVRIAFDRMRPANARIAFAAFMDRYDQIDVANALRIGTPGTPGTA